MTAAPRRRRLAPDARREQILSCAGRLFGERPYADVSTTEIAAAAGVARGLVNHYFGTKRELYLTAVRHLVTLPGGVATGVLPGSLRTRAEASVDWFLDAVAQHGRTWVLAVGGGGIGRDPEIEAILDDADDAAVDHLLAAVGLDDTADPGRNRAVIHAYGGLVKATVREWLVRGTLTREQARLLLSRSLLALLRDVLPRLAVADRKRVAPSRSVDKP